MRRVRAAAALALLVSSTSACLSSQAPLAAGEPVRGSDGTYEVTPPTDAWARVPRNEAKPSVDLSFARSTGDAWLNVSVSRERFPTSEAALAAARAQAEALLTVTRRKESDVSVAVTAAATGGELPGRLGEYCGTFDIELRARKSCFLVLAVVRDRTAYVLVGQVRLRDPEPGRQDELTTFVLSVQLLEPE